MAAADQSGPWAYLADDVLYEIVRRIPCEVDRLHAGRVCHSWRAALAKLNLPAPHPLLPWLVLLEDDDEHGLTFSCVLSECRTHPFFLPHAARRARYFGSFDGAWLFLAVDGQGAQDQDHVLVNLNNFQYLDLPNAIFPFDWIDLENITIAATTLSRPPTEQGCIVAEAEQPVWLWPPKEVEDLLCHNADFLFLTGEEHIRVCPEPAIFHEAHHVQIQWRFQPRPRGDDDDEQVLARYLVESRGSLLMVVRLTSGRQHLQTSAFRVFQKEDLSLDDVKQDELFDNTGVQAGSYEASGRYPGMEGVYFLDDRSFHETSMEFNDRAYHCCDNGKWSVAPDLLVKRCFPERGLPDYSPPKSGPYKRWARKLGQAGAEADFHGKQAARSALARDLGFQKQNGIRLTFVSQHLNRRLPRGVPVSCHSPKSP
ncbi:hypothetical protein E2562_010003 [Oryza meyeriana var. granulata]|uniref:KIB1-4 beta-propeller domain-containing protein n=1 Tax=Oryza meyeriana var. granulata TaxID=110450 RepID=A0A6G1EK20_9ORYZ|nr:hypothetical protein E2562_010003 [Oryza meyeriana var. granulata]